MKDKHLNFYKSIFLLIVLIPFSFLCESKEFSFNTIEFVKKKKQSNHRDTIKLFEVINGEEEIYYTDFKINKGKEAYFHKDTVHIKLFAGSFEGYSLSIKLIGDKYIAELTNFNCTWRNELKIQEQRLILEDFKLIHQGKLKGNYFCEAQHKDKSANGVSKIRIRGYFELDLIDHKEIIKKLQ